MLRVKKIVPEYYLRSGGQDALSKSVGKSKCDMTSVEAFRLSLYVGWLVDEGADSIPSGDTGIRCGGVGGLVRSSYALVTYRIKKSLIWSSE